MTYTVATTPSPIELYYAEYGTVPPCQSWCVDHHDGGTVPTDSLCSSETVIIGGIETFISNGTPGDVPTIFLQQMDWAPETITPLQAAALAERLADLRSRATD